MRHLLWSRPCRWRFGSENHPKDSFSRQIAAVNTLQKNIGHHNFLILYWLDDSSTRFFKSAPILKCTECVCFIAMDSPVFGLRPIRAARKRKLNAPKSLISTRPPFASSSSIRINIIFTAASISAFDKCFCLRESKLMSSDFVILNLWIRKKISLLLMQRSDLIYIVLPKQKSSHCFATMRAERSNQTWTHKK